MRDLWDSNDDGMWRAAEQNYDRLLRKENLTLENEIFTLAAAIHATTPVREFYDFLHEKYFVWKYTAKNRLATTRKNLEKYEDDPEELVWIQRELFAFDRENISQGLEIAHRIKGLGYAGASGLLTVFFPESFGTVDRFVALRLKTFSAFSEDPVIQGIRPDSLRLKEAVYMEQLLREKANALNRCGGTDEWTPRKIDKALWAYQR